MESPFSKILLYTYGKVGSNIIKEYNNGEYFEVIQKEYKCKTITTLASYSKRCIEKIYGFINYK